MRKEKELRSALLREDGQGGRRNGRTRWQLREEGRAREVRSSFSLRKRRLLTTSDDGKDRVDKRVGRSQLLEPHEKKRRNGQRSFELASE